MSTLDPFTFTSDSFFRPEPMDLSNLRLTSKMKKTIKSSKKHALPVVAIRAEALKICIPDAYAQSAPVLHGSDPCQHP